MKSGKGKPRKPTGIVGPTNITVGESIEFQPVELPDSKESVESEIVSGYMAACHPAKEPGPSNASPNALDDWDFTITVGGSEHYLELMELAPLDGVKGGHLGAPPTHRPYAVAQFVFEKLMGKSQRYAHPGSRELWLLLYITAWQFFPSQTTINLLQYWTCNEQHAFDRIDLYVPSRPVGHVFPLFPTLTEQWRGFDPESYRGDTVTTLDPRGWKTGPD